ncbi:MAG TPA: M56 family metallopeptidase, partial [Gemmatimonadaceae bacterium]|nr:M56 family metallopeptidase [Gemmatimonadaceae bacterium]
MATSIGMHALADLALAAQGALFVLFVKSVLVLGVAALIAAMMHRRSAAARHLVWSIGLTTALALPVLSAVVPAWSIAGLPRVGWSDEAGRAAPVPVWVSLAAPKPELAPAPAPMPATAVAITGDNAPGTPAAAVDVTIASDASDGASVPEASVTAVAPEAAGAGAAVTVRVATAALHTGMLMTWPNRLSETGPLGPALLLVWLGGAVLLLLRLGLDAMTVSRLVRRATPAEEDLVLRQRLGDALLRCAVRDAELRVSDDIDVPVTWGIGSPVVLLPREATEWTAQRRALVLEHELAHVMRRDVCLHAAASVARALYWINPLAWLAVRELRNESEQACDDAVLARGVRPTRYAEELLSIARSIGAASVPALAPGLVRRPRIERRLRSLLDANMPRRLTTRRDTAVGAMAVLALALPLAAMRPVAPSREAAAPGPEFATPMALAVRVPRAIAASTAIPAMPAMPPMPVVPAMPAMRARAAGAAAVLALTPGSAAPAPSAMRIVIPAIARGGSAESAPCEANGSSSSNMTTDNDGVRTWEVHWTGRDCGVDL